MKKFIKWTGIILGGFILLIILLIIIIFVNHDRYTISYPSGGKLSENQAAYDVIYYDLDLEIHAADQSISGMVAIKLNSVIDNLAVVELDLIDNFTVNNVNQGLEFVHDDDKLLITLEKPLKAGEQIDLEISYAGQPLEAIYPPWIGGFVWSEDSSGADWIGVSCQGEGADIWFPCKDHPSDEPDSAAINITVPESYYCVSNGLLRGFSNTRDGYLTYHWFTGYPINTYNININIGKYEIVEGKYTTEGGSVMPVNYYVLPQSRKGAERLVEMAIDMLETYRKFYGEYPFTREKFGLVQTDYLGMEHQTINAYGNNYEFRNFAGVEFDWLMLHEMGHEWWGNKVTVSDYADFWLQEGICTYGEALYILDRAGEEAYHDYMSTIRRRIRNRNPIIPDKKDALSSEVYQSDIYTKGAYFMHTMRFLLGDSIFFKSLMEFATDSMYTYQNFVSTGSLIDLLQKNSEKFYPGFAQMFLYTTDLPEIEVDSVAYNTYQIRIRNIDFKLPMEIKSDTSLTVMELGPDNIKINSTAFPVVDPKNWYYKKTYIRKSAKIYNSE